MAFKLVLASLLCVSLASADHFDSVNGVKVGELRTLAHGVKGQVYAWNESTLVLNEFEYDGAGPDAFFWVGTEGEPDTVGTILPYPFQGKFYEYEDTDAPILEGAFNKERVVLTLPKTLKVSDLRWLSVWCRAFKVNFGDVFFPEDLSFDHKDEEEEPKAEDSKEDEANAAPEAEAEHDHDHDHVDSEPESHPEDESDLPPPLVSVDSNDLDESNAAAAEAEAESEAHPENKAVLSLASNIVYFAIAALAILNLQH